MKKARPATPGLRVCTTADLPACYGVMNMAGSGASRPGATGVVEIAAGLDERRRPPCSRSPEDDLGYEEEGCPTRRQRITTNSA
jgi:hypothetical protein